MTRRGRGDSRDTPPYAVEREVEDLQALIEEAGGSAYVHGISSGAALALYEPPFILDDRRPPVPENIAARLEAAIEAGRRGAAVRLFMRQVGAPRIVIALMGAMPGWSKLKAVAHTLAYDLTILAGNQAGKRLPAERWSAVTMPALVMMGGTSPAWFNNGARALARALSNARLRVLEGQTHRVKSSALAPLLVEFFNGGQASAAEEPAQTAVAP